MEKIYDSQEEKMPDYILQAIETSNQIISNISDSTSQEVLEIIE